MTMTLRGLLLMSAVVSAFAVQSAMCQPPAVPTFKGVEVVDSLISAEFAKDSIGSITVGIVAGSQLVWTRSVGCADMKARRLAMARETRRQVTQEQAAIAKLGALQSLTFKGVGPAGPNIYRATFEKGSLEWRVWLNQDGSVDVFRFHPVPPDSR